MVAGRLQYSISTSDIERVIAAHNLQQLPAASSTDASRLDALERRVTELERLVHDLRASTVPQDATIDYAVTPPHKATPQPSQREKRKDAFLSKKIQTYKNKSHP